MYKERPEIQANKKVEILQTNDKLSRLKNSKAQKVYLPVAAHLSLQGPQMPLRPYFLYLSQFFLLLSLAQERRECHDNPRPCCHNSLESSSSKASRLNDMCHTERRESFLLTLAVVTS